MTYSLETLTPEWTLGKRVQTTMATIGDDIQRLVPEVMALAAGHACGPIIARYHSWDGDGGEMEVAAIVREGTPDAAALPTGRAVVTTHVGSYQGLKDAWLGIRAHVEENGYTSCAGPWEAYLNDCTHTPEAELLTKIIWPIE